MKRSDLIKKLLPGFIPLFVFIAADEIWGTKIGLIVALGVGLLELGFTYYKEKRFDRFILLDTALLMALGGISLLLNNDIFFKIKPAVIEAIMCLMIGLSAFTKIDLVGGMSKRYLKDFEINEQVQLKFKQTLKTLFWIFGIHTLLVVYAAFFLSKEAWAFISGGLFYLLFGAYFIYELVIQRLKKKKIKNELTIPGEDEEWLPVVDETGKILGKVWRSQVHNGSKILHPVVHLHVMNHRKALYLQKRPESKLIQPGKWDTAVGGHIAFGEDIQSALQREAWEEIGLKEFSARPIGTYVFESEIERELVYSFISYDYKNIKLHSEEVQEGRFWTQKQIEQNLGNGVFTPNFELEYRKQLKEKVF